MATGGERFKAYKTKGLDVEEVRRRKVEEGVQLRKSNRDDQVRGIPLSGRSGILIVGNSLACEEKKPANR